MKAFYGIAKISVKLMPLTDIRYIERRHIMKKRTLIMSVVLTLALVFGSFTSVFAVEKTGPATDATREAVKSSGIQTVTKFKEEVGAEAFAINFANEVKTGKYKLIDTAGVKAAVDANNAIIIDTMPAGWYTSRHIPGALNQVVGAMNGPKFKILSAEKKGLLKQVKKAAGKKKYYYNSKTKKWQSKKIKGAKTKKMVNKDKKIILYCGFVGCARSHQAAMYLKKKGFTNVDRYPGGISAWVDANLPIAGTDVQ